MVPLLLKDRKMSGRSNVRWKRHVSEKNDKYATGRVITLIFFFWQLDTISNHVKDRNRYSHHKKQRERGCFYTVFWVFLGCFREQALETQADVDANVVHETQIIKDLRENGYTEDEIARCVAVEHTEDDEKEGIGETQPQC
uniref:Uncharacterized protein n=1 Tax=Lactuca sativa TaxID=4236 RepID=A0A9R1WZK7_LACSA|nr:hypothetical protein LSAT_V11C700374860 [Lactuca sativa]